jgi:hypothetical protein
MEEIGKKCQRIETLELEVHRSSESDSQVSRLLEDVAEASRIRSTSEEAARAELEASREACDLNTKELNFARNELEVSNKELEAYRNTPDANVRAKLIESEVARNEIETTAACANDELKSTNDELKSLRAECAQLKRAMEALSPAQAAAASAVAATQSTGGGRLMHLLETEPWNDEVLSLSREEEEAFEWQAWSSFYHWSGALQHLPPEIQGVVRAQGNEGALTLFTDAKMSVAISLIDENDDDEEMEGDGESKWYPGKYFDRILNNTTHKEEGRGVSESSSVSNLNLTWRLQTRAGSDVPYVTVGLPGPDWEWLGGWSVDKTQHHASDEDGWTYADEWRSLVAGEGARAPSVVSSSTQQTSSSTTTTSTNEVTLRLRMRRWSRTRCLARVSVGGSAAANGCLRLSQRLASMDMLSRKLSAQVMEQQEALLVNESHQSRALELERQLKHATRRVLLLQVVS